MAELIGVISPISMMHPAQIRHALLCFDRIAFPGGDEFRDAVASIHNPSSEIAECLTFFDTLFERGVMFDPKLEIGNAISELAEIVTPFQSRLPEMRLRFASFSSGVSDLDPELRSEMADIALRHGPSLSRLFAAMTRDQLKLRAVPFCPASEFADIVPEPVTHTEVIQFIISDLPVPAASHSVTDILDFREEARSQGFIQGLRDWMNEMGSGTLTGFEVSDKLEHLVSQYERALKLERMSRETTWLETFIFPARGVVEYLTTLSSKLFTVRRAEIDLMKAEMTLPGREVAYIVKARERFGS